MGSKYKLKNNLSEESLIVEEGGTISQVKTMFVISAMIF